MHKGFDWQMLWTEVLSINRSCTYGHRNLTNHTPGLGPTIKAQLFSAFLSLVHEKMKPAPPDGKFHKQVDRVSDALKEAKEYGQNHSKQLRLHCKIGKEAYENAFWIPCRRCVISDHMRTSTDASR